MANKNDERILKLREEIAERTEKLGKQPRFSPVTTCMITLNNEKYNLNVLDKGMLLYLKVSLNVYRMSANDLKVPLSDFKISGFTIEDWFEDIDSRLAVIGYRDEKQKLDRLEKQLTKLLSEDKQTELEIDALAAMLGL